MTAAHTTPVDRLPLVRAFLPCTHGARITEVRYWVVAAGHPALEEAAAAFLGADGAWHVEGAVDRVIVPETVAGFTSVVGDIETRWTSTGPDEWTSVHRRVGGRP